MVDHLVHIFPHLCFSLTGSPGNCTGSEGSFLTSPSPPPYCIVHPYTTSGTFAGRFCLAYPRDRVYSICSELRVFFLGGRLLNERVYSIFYQHHGATCSPFPEHCTDDPFHYTRRGGHDRPDKRTEHPDIVPNTNERLIWIVGRVDDRPVGRLRQSNTLWPAVPEAAWQEIFGRQENSDAVWHDPDHGTPATRREHPRDSTGRRHERSQAHADKFRPSKFPQPGTTVPTASSFGPCEQFV